MKFVPGQLVKTAPTNPLIPFCMAEEPEYRMLTQLPFGWVIVMGSEKCKHEGYKHLRVYRCLTMKGVLWISEKWFNA